MIPVSVHLVISTQGDGSSQHIVALPCHFQQNFAYLVDIAVIADRKGRFDPGNALAGIVDDSRIRQVAVRETDQGIVQRLDLGIECTDGLDDASVLSDLDVLSGLDGLQDEQGQAADQVAQRALHAKADGHAGGSENGKDRGERDADDIGGREDNDHGQDQLDRINKE